MTKIFFNYTESEVRVRTLSGAKKKESYSRSCRDEENELLQYNVGCFGISPQVSNLMND